MLDLKAWKAGEAHVVMGSGIWNMNPALVSADITHVSARHLRITVEGRAKEGIVKQHAGKKAVQRCMHNLVALLSDIPVLQLREESRE